MENDIKSGDLYKKLLCVFLIKFVSEKEVMSLQVDGNIVFV